MYNQPSVYTVIEYDDIPQHTFLGRTGHYSQTSRHAPTDDHDSPDLLFPFTYVVDLIVGRPDRPDGGDGSDHYTDIDCGAGHVYCPYPAQGCVHHNTRYAH